MIFRWRKYAWKNYDIETKEKIWRKQVGVSKRIYKKVINDSVRNEGWNIFLLPYMLMCLCLLWLSLLWWVTTAFRYRSAQVAVVKKKDWNGLMASAWSLCLIFSLINPPGIFPVHFWNLFPALYSPIPVVYEAPNLAVSKNIYITLLLSNHMMEPDTVGQ